MSNPLPFGGYLELIERLGAEHWAALEKMVDAALMESPGPGLSPAFVHRRRGQIRRFRRIASITKESKA